MVNANSAEVLQPESPFSYQCKRCLQCCRSRQVLLNPFDIACLAAHESVSTGQFIDQYLLLSKQGAFLKHALEGDCAWLSGDGCRAYQSRPLSCRTYPLFRQSDLDGQVSLVKLEQVAGSAGIFQAEGSVEIYLEQNQCKRGSNAADQYAELFISLFKHVEQSGAHSSNIEALLADTVLFQRILLDMDLMLACYQPGSELTLDIEQKMYLHINAINAWLVGELKTFVLLDAFARDRNNPRLAAYPTCASTKSEIEGCEWPFATSRLNTWVIALDYQFKQGLNTSQHARESMLLQQLDSLLKQHSESSPFYKARWPEDEPRGLTCHRFRDVPLLRREQMREAGALLFSTRVPPSHGAIIEQSASVSTYAEFMLKITELSLAFQKALYAGFLSGDWLAQGPRCTVILSGSATYLNMLDKGLHWGSCPGSNPVKILDSSTLSITELVESLLIERPGDIISTPDSWLSLSAFLDEKGIQVGWLEHVFIVQSKETGFALDTRFPPLPVPLIEIFTLPEVGIVAARKVQGEAFKVPLGHLLVEILNRQNKPCKEGETGRIVVTDLHNFVTPFIRYETDVAAIPMQVSSTLDDQTGCYEFALTGNMSNV